MDWNPDFNIWRHKIDKPFAFNKRSAARRIAHFRLPLKYQVVQKEYDSVESGDESEGSVEEWGFLKGQLNSCEDEPLADVGGDENSDSDDDETYADGLTPAVLEGRFERTYCNSWLVVSKWYGNRSFR